MPYYYQAEQVNWFYVIFKQFWAMNLAAEVEYLEDQIGPVM